ncbi:uncharacterized protein LOC134265290 [Saccostrea cucullata]|uniref:uncharacterized protein LOC134265290 n=1 Tax=Saccostrea cuccullata TaxID=36930 RepID=UPI002ED3F27A
MSTTHNALLPTDGSEGKEPRETKLTEKGEEYYKNQKDILYRKLESASKILIDCIVNSEPLPKSISLLETTEGTLRSTFQRYDTCANNYLDFLSRSRDPEATQELEKYWPVMTDLKKEFNTLMEKIDLKKESAESQSHRSSRTKTSRSSTSSASLAASKRAKAESEKVKLQFVKRETEIKKEQFAKTLQLEVLEQEKIAAAADAEASYLERQFDDDIVNTAESVNPPKEEMSPFDKTLNYLDGLNSPVRPTQTLSPQATPFIPLSRVMPGEVESSTPGFINQSVNRGPIDSTAHHPITLTRPVDTTFHSHIQ